MTEQDPGMTSDEMVIAVHEIVLNTPREKSKIRILNPKKIKDWESLTADIRKAQQEGLEIDTDFQDGW